MHRKRKIAYIIEAIFVFVLMFALTSIAVPKIGEMIGQDPDEIRADQFHKVKVAVSEMLSESTVILSNRLDLFRICRW